MSLTTLKVKMMRKFAKAVVAITKRRALQDRGRGSFVTAAGGGFTIGALGCLRSREEKQSFSVSTVHPEC